MSTAVLHQRSSLAIANLLLALAGVVVAFIALAIAIGATEHTAQSRSPEPATASVAVSSAGSVVGSDRHLLLLDPRFAAVRIDMEGSDRHLHRLAERASGE